MAGRATLAIAAAIAVATPLPAQKLPSVRSEQVEGSARVEIVDLTPRFLAFYDAAKSAPDADARFALWQQHYGFAAVPPGPRGEELSRKLLDEGWPRYEAALPTIRRGSAIFGNEPIQTLGGVMRVLEAEGPVSIKLTAYVGAFDDNAFSTGGDPPNIAFPVEMGPELRRLIMAHEFTHAVHIKIAGLSGGWERSIGATILQEGLAIHVARELTPGLTMAQYIEHRPGWWVGISERKPDVLRGMLPMLAKADGETVFRFTIGEGTTGFDRESYAAGWWVVEHLRNRGMSLADIGRLPENEMPAIVERAVNEILAQE